MTLSTLPVGNYVVEYFGNVDFGKADCQIGSVPLELRGSAGLTVAPSGLNRPPARGPVAAVYEYIHDGFGGHFFMTEDEDDKLAIVLRPYIGSDIMPTP